MRWKISPWTLAVILLLLLVGSGFYRHFKEVPQSSTVPERKVEGQVLTSERAPAVTLRFDPAFRYIGGQRFPLLQVADAEQHVFVDAGDDKVIRRAFWVQFEAYFPTVRAAYDYSDDRKVTIHGAEFYERFWISSPHTTPPPDSDSAWFRDLLRARGYTLPPDGRAVVRQVHLPDKEKRTELMLVYMQAVPAPPPPPKENPPKADKEQPGSEGEPPEPPEPLNYRKLREESLAAARSLVEIKLR